MGGQPAIEPMTLSLTKDEMQKKYLAFLHNQYDVADDQFYVKNGLFVSFLHDLFDQAEVIDIKE